MGTIHHVKTKARILIDLGFCIALTVGFFQLKSQVFTSKTETAPRIGVLIFSSNAQVAREIMLKDSIDKYGTNAEVSIQSEGDSKGNQKYSAVINVPIGASSVYIANALKADNEYSCSNITYASGTNNLHLGDSSLTTSTFNGHRYLRIDTSSLQFTEDISEVRCELNLPSTLIDSAHHSIGIENDHFFHVANEKDVSQYAYVGDFNGLSKAQGIVIQQETHSNRLSSEDALIHPGGFIVGSWLDSKLADQRDNDLLIAGALIAFLGSFIIDLILLLVESLPDSIEIRSSK